MTARVLRGFPWSPFKNKVFKMKRQDPGKRSLPGRPLKTYQESLTRRALRPGKIRRATSFRTRQDDGRGKELAAGNPHFVPALQHTC